MQTLFTQRSPRPSARSTLSLLPFLLLLFSPFGVFAQGDQTCYEGLTAGPNRTYCQGELVTLEGGYAIYDEPGDGPNTGSVTVTWIVAPGFTGDLIVDGVNEGNSYSATNFNHPGNTDPTLPVVQFQPEPGTTLASLRIRAVSTNPICETVETQNVLLYFDEPIEMDMDVVIDGDVALNNVGAGAHSAAGETGDLYTVIIDNDLTQANSEQYEDPPVFDYEITGGVGLVGLAGVPMSGTVSALEFNNLFRDLELVNLTCEDIDLTVTVNSLYERDPTDSPAASGPCPGPETAITLTVARRDIPVATIGVEDEVSAVCEDDDDVQFIVTGTAFTTVTYNVSFDGGATNAIEGATLDLGATQLSEVIIVDANDGTAGQDIVVTLTQIAYQEAAACPETIAKVAQVQVVPLPTLALELVDPDDAILCNQANGGPSFIQYRVLTMSGDGVYSFTVTDIANGVEIQDVTFNNRTFTNGVGPTLGFGMGGAFESPQLLELRVDGASITREDLILACTNDSPDASVSWTVQPDIFTGIDVTVGDGEPETLDNDSPNNTLEVAVCDEGTLSIDGFDVPENFAAAAGTSGQVEVTVSNPDGVLGAPTGGVFDLAELEYAFSGALDIDNDQATASQITMTITPYFEDNDDEGLNGDECEGETLTLIINVLPAPSVTVTPLEPVCEGETVDVIITASEPGTASLIIGQGGAPIIVEVDDHGEGGIFGVYTSGPLEPGMNQFTVTTFVGDVNGCESTVNQMVMTDVEPRPTATISIEPGIICSEGSATLTFTGSGGTESGYTFTYSINGQGPLTVSTDSEDESDTDAEVGFEGIAGPATLSIELISVANNSELACDAPVGETETLTIEEEPTVDPFDDLSICSGEAFEVTPSSNSTNPSAAGSDLVLIVEVDNPLAPVSPSETDTFDLASAELPLIYTVGAPISNAGLTFTGDAAGVVVNTCDCPPGHVAVGFQGNTGLVIDGFELVCAPVNSDGSVDYGNLVNSCRNGGFNGNPEGPDITGPLVGLGVSLGDGNNNFGAQNWHLAQFRPEGKDIISIAAGADNTSGNTAGEIFGFPETFSSGTLGNDLGDQYAPDGHVIVGMETYSPAFGPNWSTGVRFRYAPVNTIEVAFIGGAPVNNTGVEQVMTFTVTPAYDVEGLEEFCLGEPETFTVTVAPMPMATFGGDAQTICEGEDATLTFTGPPNGSATLVQLDDNGDAIVATEQTINFDGGGTATLELFGLEETISFQLSDAANAGGECIGAMVFGYAVIVVPTPEAEFAPDLEATICEGEDVTIAVTGTPEASVSINSASGNNDQDIELDEDGQGTFTLEAVAAGDIFTIGTISLDSLDGDGNIVTCTGEGDEEAEGFSFTLIVDPAPTGALVSNAILCAGDEPEVQFNNTTGDGFTGTFDFTVNGIDFFGISDGDVLDFGGTAFETLDATTVFTLANLTRNSLDGSLACDALGDGVPATVTVNPVPEVVIDPLPAVVCSGDEVNIVASFTPAASEDGNPLFFEVTVDDGFGPLADGDVLLIPAATDLNTALGLPTTFDNNASTGNDGSLGLTIVPFYEAQPDNPVGIDDCMEGASGFTGDFAESNWEDVSFNDNSDPTETVVEFTPTDLTLTLIVGNNEQFFKSAATSYTFANDGEFSLDYAVDLFDETFALDRLVVDYEGDILYRSESDGQNDSGTVGAVVKPGDQLVISLRHEFYYLDGTAGSSSAVINNFSFQPTCQPCPGEAAIISFEILPELFADFDEAPGITVCEDEPITTCITGSPDVNVSVFIGGGAFVDVKLDEEGNGCLELPGGLTADVQLIITGINTLDGALLACNNLLGADGPTLDVTVIPTPEPSVTVDEPGVVCDGGSLNATITGPAGATVTYSTTLDGTITTGLTALLDGDGEASVSLPTGNDGDASIAGTITLTSISVPNPDPARDDCVTDVDVSAGYTVRPTPDGTLSVGDPVCAGGEVPVSFTPTSELQNDYTLVIADPEGAETTYTVTASAGSPVEVFSADVAGTYTLVSITDGVGTDVECTNEELEESVIVIIEVVPDLKADISGTVGTASLDNGTIFDAFTAVTCDMGTVDAAFDSDTDVSPQTGSDLMVEVTVVNNDGLMLGLPAASTFVIDYASLTFSGLLENTVAPDQANITVILTPFFEADGDPVTLGEDDCAGETLTFDITVLPAVELEFDDATSTTVVCENGEVTINISGSAGGVVNFSTENLSDVVDSDDTEDASDGEVTLDADGEAVITATADQGVDSATVILDMIVVTTTVGNQVRVCMEMEVDTLGININEVPEAMLFLEPAGPICNEETVDVNLMLTDTDFEVGGSYTVEVDGESYTVTVDADGKAFLFTSEALTGNTCFSLTSISDDATDCLNDLSDDPEVVGVLVEEVPAGEIEVTIDGETTIVADGVPAEFTICANETVDLEAISRNGGGGNGSFTAELSSTDPTWSRGSCTSAGNYYFDAYSFTITEEDTYTFTMGNSPLDDFLYLYSGGFDPVAGSCGTLIAANDDGGPPDGLFNASLITITLDMVPGEYTLVATSYFILETGGYEISYGSENGGQVVGLPGVSGNLTGESFVSVDFSISEDIDFFGLGQSGTIALPIEDFGDVFSATYSTIFGEPITVDLAVTYYNENDPEGEEPALDDDECEGITDNITIIINPNPKTDDVTTMICSGESVNYDLDAAITNGVEGATFTYTVESDDIDVSGLDRSDDSGDPITDVFVNFSDEDYTVVYTVTPFGAEGCQGNDFTLTVTVKPEPVITEGQSAEVCSGVETLCVILLDNERDDNNSVMDSDTFVIIDIEYSLEGDEFIIDEDNAMVGDSGNFAFIAFDVFTNLSSEPQTVTYTIRPIGGNGCVGEDETIVVTILPEPVVEDIVLKVCSGGSVDLGFEELTANGVGNILSFSRSAIPLTTLRVFDETGADVTLGTFAGASFSNPGVTAIGDSYLNQGTATLSVFYDVVIEVTGEDGLVCAPATLTVEVQVLEETDVVLEPINGQTSICEGEPITLVANYDGSGTATDFEYSCTSEDGVELELTPSAAGGEVEVSALSGSGTAVVMVMVTDDNDCVAMGTRTVSVGGSPEELEIDGFEDPCTGMFTPYSIEPTEGSTYVWSLSNPAAGSFTNQPATGANVSITFNDSQGFGPFEVMVTETNAAGCSTTSSMTVTLFNTGVSDFSAEESEEDPLTWNFTELAGGTIQNYIWDFGDGSDLVNEPNPTHTFQVDDPEAVQEFDVTLTVISVCGGVIESTQTIVLNDDSETDMIELVRGVNFVSFDVAPDNNQISSLFAGVPGLVEISTMDANNATAYYPALGPFNSLTTIEPGYGYVIVMDQDATVSMSGPRLPETFARPLDPGISFIGYCGENDMVATDFMGPMEANENLQFAMTFGDNVPGFFQTYIPGPFAAFSSLQTVHNGLGYMVELDAAMGGNAGALASGEEQRASESYEFIYGTVGGTDYRSGDPVEILDSRGTVIGTIAPDETGLFKLTAIYGKVTHDGRTVGSLDMDESISFRYNGQTIDSDVAFHGNYEANRVDLDFSSERGYGISVQPNPAYTTTSVVLTLDEATSVAVRALDVNGRQVKQLLPRQTLTAGTTTLAWDDLGELPAGMYHIVVEIDGQLEPELTQRLVKR